MKTIVDQLLTDNMYKWKDEHTTIYVEHISHQHSLHYTQSLCDDLELVTSSDDINTSASNFVNHIDGICKPLFGKRNVTPGSKSTSRCVHKHSFTNDSTCEPKRKEYYKLLNIYGRNKNC